MANIVKQKFHARTFVIDRAEGKCVTQRVEGKEVVTTRVEGGVEKETTKKPLGAADVEFERMGAPVFTNPVSLGKQNLI